VGRHNCGNCHAEIFQEWSQSGHARSAVNRCLLDLVAGTDWHGRPGKGWSLRDEHPAGVAVCASCHAPTLTDFRDPAFDDLRKVRGVAAQGVHCDYCHKIAGPDPQARLGITHGRFGLALLRPTEHQLFFGPLADVDRGEDAYSPFYRHSRYCASCHEGIVFGVHVYSTYSEWLQSPARRQGKHCQHCHMAPTGKMTNIAPGRGGIERDPQTLASHAMFSPSLDEMLRRCLKVLLEVRQHTGKVQVEVVVVAEDVGHKVPTGFVDRNLVLVVEAFQQGRPAPLQQGPVLPSPAGKGTAGKPGRLFAKQLTDGAGYSPAPFWRARTDLHDSRLSPGQPNRSVYQFAAGVDRIEVRLLYRRFWPEVIEQKSWPDDTITVVETIWQSTPR
jgi:hypothetical protein